MRRRTKRASIPGPTLVLRRGEPVEITLVNRLTEATAIHWHGMELDSYYDGVHGWSGLGTRITPIIKPGDTFVVRFTPPRYRNVHLSHPPARPPPAPVRACTARCWWSIPPHPDSHSIPSIDHVFVIGSAGRELDAPAVLNGTRDPRFVVEGRHSTSRPADQHHDQRRLHRVAARRRRARHVASADERRSSLATRSLGASARAADNRRRRDLRLRVSDAARTAKPVAGSEDAQGGSGRFRGRLLFDEVQRFRRFTGFRVQEVHQPVGALPLAGIEISQQPGRR